MLMVFFVFFFSCKKNQLGGKSTVSGSVSHHSKLIAGASIFIKFNAKEFPGTDTALYDTKVTADANGKYTVDDFYKGDYYLFAVGKDYAIAAPYIVQGGLAVHLRTKEKLARNIAVTEGD
jgi:hypothetical protein